MNEIKIWNYDNSKIRTIDVNGEPWFVLKDVCSILDMGSNRAGEVTKRLDQDEYDSIVLTDSLGREQVTYIVNESGLYTVILRSDKPQAKPFRKWVTSVVLPSIRKTGNYNTQSLSPMEMIAAMANNAVETERRLKEIELKAAETSSKLDQALDIFTETLAEPDWKHCMNHRISTICERYHLSHQKTRGDLYSELELIANCNLNSRVIRKKKRLRQAGAKYRDAQAVTKLDVIADDQKLKPIFDGIVKKLEAKYIQGDNVQLGLVEIP